MCPTFCRSHVIELYPVIVGFTAGRTCQPILIVSATKTASFLVVSISQMRVAGIPGNTNPDYSPGQLCVCTSVIVLNAICCTRPPRQMLLLLYSLSNDHHLYNKRFLLQDAGNHWQYILNLNRKREPLKHFMFIHQPLHMWHSKVTIDKHVSNRC